MGCTASSLAKGGSDFHKDYILSQKLGEGSFAQVFVCQDRNSKDTLAVKVLDASAGQIVRQDARKEAQLWQRTAGSPHCVNLVNFFEDSKFCYMVMEKCSCTVLEAFLKEDDTGEDELCHCFKGMLEGLQFIHARGIVHRDVKPDNFLLEDGTKFSKDAVVKLCDFGLAAAMPRKLEGKDRLLHRSSASPLTTICGTAPYMAPEMVTKRKGGYDTAVDVWAVGVSAYLMLFGEYPYRPAKTGSQEMMDAIRDGKNPSYKARSGFPQPSLMACEFVRDLLNRSEQSRPDAESAQQNTFIRRMVRPVPQHTVVHSEPDMPQLPGAIRNDTRKQSFHHTLKAAQNVAAQQYLVHVGRGGDVVRFPTPEIKNSFEKALMEMQKEHCTTLRNSKRTMSGPSKSFSQVTFSDLSGPSDEASIPKANSDFTGRSKTRHSTHSGSFYMVFDRDEESGSDGGDTRASSTADDKDIALQVAQLKDPDMWGCRSEMENKKANL
jgi:serine/threonine protein kinase